VAILHWELCTIHQEFKQEVVVHRDTSSLWQTTSRSGFGSSTTATTLTTSDQPFFPPSPSWYPQFLPNHHHHHYDANNNNPTFTQPSTPQCAPIHVPVDPALRPGRRTIQLLFQTSTIPDVNTQPGRGYSLQGLTAFDGQLHLGYGDSVENSGPLSMHSYHPWTGTWTYRGMLGTEELRVFRIWYNAQNQPQRLYTPEIDAHGDDRRTQAVVYQLECGWAAQWTTSGTPIDGSAHVYDLHLGTPTRNSSPSSSSGGNHTPTTPTLWASTGSRTNKSARLVESVDNGQTWYDVYRVPVVQNAYSRIYFIGRTSYMDFVWGRVNVHKSEQDGAFALVRYHTPKDDKLDNNNNTSTMTTTQFRRIRNLPITIPEGQPPFMPQLRPIVHQDYMVLVAHPYRFGPHVGTYQVEGYNLVPIQPWPTMEEDDGKENTNDSTGIVTWTFDDQQDHLYILTTCCNDVAQVWRTTSLASGQWESIVHLGTLPDNDMYFSMTLLYNDLYLGTDQGNIYVVKEIYQPAGGT
jgi:hypothetical protein